MQSGSSARSASTSLVARTPNALPRLHNVPTSTPTFSGEYAYAPTRTRSGRANSAFTASTATLPVVHCTTRSTSSALLVMRRRLPYRDRHRVGAAFHEPAHVFYRGL